MINETDKQYWEMIHGSGRHNRDAYPANKCPACGGSSKGNEKKFYLYTKNDDKAFVKCFRASCEYGTTFSNYLRTYHPEMYGSYKSTNKEYDLVELANSFNKPNTADTAILNNTQNDVDNTNMVQHNLEVYNLNEYFIPIANNIEAMEYIKSRNIPINPMWMYANTDLQIGDMLYKTAGNIIVPLLVNNQWYGFYSRSISKKEFITFIPPNNQGYKVWNWFNINKSEPTFIFEAIFNAIASGIPNSIASLGGSLNIDRVKELKQPIFCFDNDKAGYKLSYKMAELGYSIVILPHEYKNIKDYNQFTQKHILNSEQIKDLILKNIYDPFSAMVELNLRGIK